MLAIAQTCAAQAKRNHSPDQHFTGRSSFNSSCAGCHGLDGRGSDKAANITTSEKVRRLSDTQLSGIILNGIPGTGMPSFRVLHEREIHAIISYLRSLQGDAGARSLPGNAERGKEIFFGRGGCSSCHTIAGEGGFLGPDLTDYGATASGDTIRDEIVRSVRTPGQGYEMASLILGDGGRLEGLVRNEDNFSMQLQTSDGSFHFLQKAELRKFEHLKTSLMPTDYGKRLTTGELDDLVSYLMKACDGRKPTGLSKKKDDFE
jgi:putative heme-binding domain-containing protein